MSPCEKEINGLDGKRVVCGAPGTHGLLDPTGQRHWFCGDHLWESSPATGDKTCDMMGANPPSLERCGRPASTKWTGPFGESKYWCERCRRKHWPTDAERVQDEAAALRGQKQADWIYGFVFKPIGWLLQLAMAGILVYGIVAFIKWCWIHS